ncbi:carbohydrate-binding domain-containing protein [Actinospongicola halichondriae]|uniref:carbohydrate-binding domain-containing protein n=1 Tax=Actinospongicola halichondriae TaxID=3236844 RepID=UPI003D47D0AE
MNKRRMQAAAALTALTMLVTACGTEGDTASAVAETAEGDLAAVTDDNVEPHTIDPFDFAESEVERISLGSTIETTSDGVSVDGTTATIESAGVYEITGTVSDGQVVVDAGDDAVVRLILDDADITNDDGAAIAVMTADTAVVILADGSSNTLADGAVYDLPDGEDEPNATLFSKTDLTLAGTGTLAVVANANDGIASKDGLVIEDGTITIDAVDDGIRGRDYVAVDGGDLAITAGGDGIKADNDEDADRGFVRITGGTIGVVAGDDGIQATTDALVSDGDLTVAATDDGIHADLSVTVDGGSIAITESFEGIEAEVITINDGSIDITSNDDGLNVASAEATTETTFAAPGPGGGGPGGPGGDEGVGDHYIFINGGTTTIIVTDELAEQGDGIDANGHVEMTGGLVVVSGPTDTRNSAIDYSGGSFEVSGGTLVGTNIDGRNSEGVGIGSSQASVYVTFGSTIEAGTLVNLQSVDGESLVTFAPTNEFDVLVFTSPDLVAGEEYEVYVGGTGGDLSVSGLYDTYTPGTSAGTITAA